MNLLVAIALGDALRGNFLPSRQVTECGDQTLEFLQVKVLRSELTRQLICTVLQNAWIFPGIYGKAMIAILNIECAANGIEEQFQFAAFEHSAVMIVKHRHQNFSTQFFFQRMPVDIEKVGINGRFPVLQNIEPPGVVAAHHSHMIGHDVHDYSHAVLVENFHKAIEILGSANLRIERIVIDNVVSMHASGASLQARRQIAVTDAERGKIGDDRRCLREREVAVQLQAIGRARNVRRRRHDFRNHKTDQPGSIPRSMVSAPASGLA